MLPPSLSGELSNLGYIPWPRKGKSIKNEKKIIYLQQYTFWEERVVCKRTIFLDIVQCVTESKSILQRDYICLIHIISMGSEWSLKDV